MDQAFALQRLVVAIRLMPQDPTFEDFASILGNIICIRIVASTPALTANRTGFQEVSSNPLFSNLSEDHKIIAFTEMVGVFFG